MAGLDSLLDEVDLSEHVSDNPDGSKTLRLEYPFSIRVNGEDVAVDGLRLRRPKARELDAIENMPPGKQNKALRSFAHGLIVDPPGVPGSRIDDMDAEDAIRLVAAAASFFAKLRSKDGEKQPTS